MSGRTFAIGDVHGELDHLVTLLERLPALDSSDTLVFLGDYIDRGPRSREVIELVSSELPWATPAKLVCLRGNHEDAWLQVRARGWPEFVLPECNGCRPTWRSFLGLPDDPDAPPPPPAQLEALLRGTFFPPDVVEWLQSLPFFYEDEHAIYVHAGLPKLRDGWMHPSQLEDPRPLLWLRNADFFAGYRGKRVVFGHTATDVLPQELSWYTVDDPTDMFAGECVLGIDTGCGNGGYLTAVELPSVTVYESR
jgi:serine/threonine protein phosphatase 1